MKKIILLFCLLGCFWYVLNPDVDWEKYKQKFVNHAVWDIFIARAKAPDVIIQQEVVSDENDMVATSEPAEEPVIEENEIKTNLEVADSAVVVEEKKPEVYSTIYLNCGHGIKCSIIKRTELGYEVNWEGGIVFFKHSEILDIDFAEEN